MRIGHGYDIHRLVAGGPLILAGIEIPHERGLEGHSDADVVAHAVGDALLGAVGAGDLGSHFPSSDERWRGASGRTLLTHIVGIVADRGWQLANADVTLIAQEPRLAPHREKLGRGLADLLGVDVGRVNLKLKSHDRLGALGRAEGIAAHAVVLLKTAGEPA